MALGEWQVKIMTGPVELHLIENSTQSPSGDLKDEEVFS